MARQRRNTLQTAEKHAARGKFEAAIKEYEKVLASDPGDTNTLNRVGDLYVRLKRNDKAIQRFGRAAEHFFKEGFYVKAIAIYKKIIRLDPTRIDVYETLADLYHRQGLTNEAATQYQVVADYYSRNDDHDKVLAINERMVELQPSNPSHRVRLAELYCELDRVAEATQQYREIASFMLAHDKVDEAIKVYRGAFDLDPKDLNYLADALLHFKEEGYPEAARELLEYAQQQNPKADGVAHLAGLKRSASAEASAASEDQAVQEPQAEATVAATTPPTPTTESSLAVEEEEPTEAIAADGDSQVELADTPASEEGEATPETQAEEDLKVDSSPETETEFELDLTELEEEAEAEEEAAVEDEVQAEPEAPEVVEEVVAAAPEPVDPAIARAAELINEARILSNYGLGEKAVELCHEALESDPGSLDAHALVTRLYANTDQNDLAVQWGRKTAATALASEQPQVWEELTLFLQEKGFEVDGSRIQAPEIPEVPEAPEVVEEEPRVPEVPPVAEAPTKPAREEKLDWLDQKPAAVSPQESTTDELFAQENEFFDLAAELEQELAEDEAAIDEDGATQPEQPTEQSLEEIVEGFKRGVAETLSAEDYDTHYNLGIAYREMGLLDEAIGEFQLAAKDPRYLVECCSMLGTCFLEKGFADLAVKWYERGLASPQITENETLGLMYELGNLHMRTGNRDAAFETFGEIYGTNSNYRDVVARLEELKHTTE